MKSVSSCGNKRVEGEGIELTSGARFCAAVRLHTNGGRLRHDENDV